MTPFNLFLHLYVCSKQCIMGYSCNQLASTLINALMYLSYESGCMDAGLTVKQHLGHAGFSEGQVCVMLAILPR
jgi:hypothetical protein